MGTRYVFSITRSDSAKPLAASPRCTRACWETLTALAGPVSDFARATAECASASLVSASVPASATGGAPGCMEARGSTAAGRTLYSTVIRSRASSAMASSSAATAATGCPTNTTRSMARTAWARVGAFFLSCGMSAAVMTARTPGSALAALTSIDTILACACGLRSSLACSMPRGLMSATYCTRPVTFSGPSGRGIDSPTPLTSRVVFMVDMSGAPGDGRLGGLADGGDHLRVARAPTEITRDAVADLLLARLRILGEEGGGGHEDTGDAEAALGHAVPDEGVLQRMEDPVVAQALDGGDRAPAGLHGEHETARHRLAVEVHGARAAVPGAAAFLGPGQAEVLAKRVEQGLVGLHEHLDSLAVDRGAQDLFRHVAVPPQGSGARAGERRGERATGENADEVPPEIRGAALIADGLGALHGEIGGPVDQLGREGLALEGGLGGGGADRGGGDRGQRDTGLGADAVGQGHLRCHPHDRDVELASRRVTEVASSAARAGRRCDDLHEELVGAEHRRADAGEEVRERHSPLALRTGDHRLGLESEQGRGHVGGGRRVAEVAADRREVAYLHGADERSAVRDGRVPIAHSRVELDLTRGHRGADAQPGLRIALEHVHLRDAGEVDDALGGGDAVLHLREETGAAREKLGLRTTIGEETQALVQAFGQGNFESSHAEPPKVSRRSPALDPRRFFAETVRAGVRPTVYYACEGGVGAVPQWGRPVENAKFRAGFRDFELDWSREPVLLHALRV